MDYMKFRECCLSVRQRRLFILCGSTFELPLRQLLINPTDSDRLYYMLDICAVNIGRQPPENFKGATLVIESVGNQPGFVRLKRLNGDHSYFLRPENLIEDHSQGPAKIIEGNYHLPSNLLWVLQQINPIWKNLELMKIDECYSVYCPYWPQEAQEWLNRKRPGGWPDQRLIKRIKRGGCHFVSKPHHSNPYDNSQWRFSFSKAELILIHSWTPVQKQVYHLLRLIKNKITEECGGSEKTVLRTYYFKTLMLWACEEKLPEFWNASEIDSCVRELLVKMIAIMIKRSCPNYFIPDYNLIEFLTEEADTEKEINIMTHALKTKCFNELDSTPKIVSMVLKLNPIFWMSNRISEYLFLSCRCILTPLLENSYESSMAHFYMCKCFLPGLKHIYEAITANIELMSIQGSERSTNKQCSIALDGYRTALNSRTDDAQKLLLFGLHMNYSGSDVINKTFSWPPLSHKINKSSNLENECELSKYDSENTIINLADDPQSEEYHSMTLDSSEKKLSAKNFIDSSFLRKPAEVIKNIVKYLLEYFIEYYTNEYQKDFPSPLYFQSAAYLANFHYVAMKDHEKAVSLCADVLKRRVVLKKIFGGYTDSHFERNVPMIITVDWATLFDEHIQTVLGFVILCEAVSSINTSDMFDKLVVTLSPVRFLRYIQFQCSLKRSENVPKIFSYRCKFKFQENASSNLITIFFSEAFLSAAINCSGVKIMHLSSSDSSSDMFGDA